MNHRIEFKTVIPIAEMCITILLALSYTCYLYLTVVVDRSAVGFFFYMLSLAYFIVLKVYSPGLSLNNTNGTIKGICGKCGSVRGHQTRHCAICDKCFYKRDHHSIIIGKCVANDNLKEYIYFLFFTICYMVHLLLNHTQKLLAFSIIIVLSVLLFWICLAVMVNKSSADITAADVSNMTFTDANNLKDLLLDSPKEIFMPFLKKTMRIEEI